MLCIFSLSAYSQGEIDNQNKILFSDEYSISLNLNTNGYGVGFRYGKYKDYLHKTTYRLQLNSLRSPKEVRLASATGMSIYGKKNSVFTLLGSLGKKNEKTSQFDKNSVAIHWIYEGGIALAIQKPVYYHVLYPDGQDVIEKFDESNYTKYGKASFAYGFNEITIVPGLTAMTSAEFNFSSKKTFMSSVEIGASAQLYIKDVDILCYAENHFYFVTLFVNLHFGKIRS